MFERDSKEFNVLGKILGGFVKFMRVLTSWYIAAPLWFCIVFFIGGQPLWFSLGFAFVCGYVGWRVWSEVDKDRNDEESL